MREQCKTCGWYWEKCDEHIFCSDCPMNNVKLEGRECCYCLFVGNELDGYCPNYVQSTIRKESGDEDNTEM